MNRNQYPWMPVGATYVQGRWMVLMARWTPDEGWTFQERVEDDLEQYLTSEHAGGTHA